MSTVHLDRGSWRAPDRPGRIIHLGIGNFSRAHQAWYTAVADPAGEWGITAFTGRGPTAATLLSPQDGLYTLIERGPQTDRFTVIDTVIAVHPAAEVDRLIAEIAAPDTAIITLTVTEAGYTLGSDADPLPSVPRRLAAGLAARRSAGAGPLAIISCDNVSANGTVLAELTLAAAAEHGPGVQQWIAEEVAFVSTSVDRITPPASADDRRLVEGAIDRVDDAPVVCEPFSDWVLCGAFPAGRPRWEDAGARFVDDLAPWELLKLWLLNGGHSLLAYLGLLRGHTSVDAAAADPELVVALNRYWDLAAARLSAHGLDLERYRRDLLGRFANPRIAYPLSQIAGDGLGKLRNRVVPVIAAAQTAGDSLEPALVIIAAWIQWLDSVADPVGVDAGAGELEPVLALPMGPRRTRAALDLLAPALSSRAELSETIEALRAQLARPA